MDLQKTLRSLKHTRDEELLLQIETAYPADWNPERLFEKSYRNYLKQTQTAETSLRNRRSILYKTIGIMACLLFTVGIGLGIYSRQERLDRKPPQETAPECDPEAVTEASLQAETEPAVDKTEAPSAKPAERPTATSEPVAAPALQEPESTVMETAATVIQKPDPTEKPVAPEQHETGTQPETDPPVSETEFQPTDPTEPDSTSDPDVILVDESLLPWFVIEEVNGVTQIRAMQEVEPSPAEWVTYGVEAEQFTLTDVCRHRSSCEYRIIAAETERTLTVYQYERTAFVRLWDTELNAEVVQIHGHPGCAWADANGKCGLLWDDGQYTFVVEASAENADLLTELAESIQ